jgi:hypothetical protein
MSQRRTPKGDRRGGQFAARTNPESTPDLATVFSPREMLEVLERHGVEYVVIGGFGAYLHSAVYVTRDIDVTPKRDRENLGRLATALKELEARPIVDGDPHYVDDPLDAHSFDWGTTWTYMTKFGRLDVALLPDGTQGYPDLARSAVDADVGDELIIRVASLADIIRSKAAAGREKDQAVLPTLRRALEMLDAETSGEPSHD